MTKLIREARMGKPKTFKSGAIYGSYPKPMLVWMFDQDGMDIVPYKNAQRAATDIPMDVTFEEVVFIRPAQITEYITKPADQQPKILCVNMAGEMPTTLSNGALPPANRTAYDLFEACYNKVASMPRDKPFPWKTMVLDSTTSYSDCAKMYVAAWNPSAMLDARQWASMVGEMIRKLVLTLNRMPCHAVTLLHSTIDKNELTNEVTEDPDLYSKGLRNDFFGLFSQVFYSTITSDNKPIIWPSSRYPVKGIGPRWPQGLPRECAPDFKSIYGKELGVV